MSAPGSLGVQNSRLGLFLFLAAEAMLYTGFFGAWIFLRRAGEPWPPEIISPAWGIAASAFVLGFTLALNRAAARAAAGFWGALFFGASFLGLVFYRWQELVNGGLELSSSLFTAFFFWLAGLYSLRFAAGLAGLTLAWVKKDAEGLELAAIYGYSGAVLWAALAVLFFVL